MNSCTKPRPYSFAAFEEAASDNGREALLRGRISVVIVSDFGEANGGAAQVAILGARALAESGIFVNFVFAVAPASPLLNHERIRAVWLGLSDIRSITNPLHAAADGIWNREAAAAFTNVVAGLDPQGCVVHFHQWTRACSPSVLDVAANSGLPMIISMHDYFAVCPNGNYHNHSTNIPCNCVPMSLGCAISLCDRQSHLHKMVRLARQVKTDRILRRTKHIHFIHVSRLARRVAEPFLPSHALHTIVPNPCVVEHNLPVDVARNKSFAFIGRFTLEKGCVAFAEAARSCGAPAMFLGGGAEEAAIRAANPDAEIISWGDRLSVSSVLRRARAVVLPSFWLETSGLVAVEALASGVPLIASNRVGVANEMVEHGANGLLFEPNVVGQLKNSLEYMMNVDEDVVSSMGHEAFTRYWRQPRTLNAHALHLIEVYKRTTATLAQSARRGDK